MLPVIGYIFIYVAFPILSIYLGEKLRRYKQHKKILEGIKEKLDYSPYTNPIDWTISHKTTGWGKKKKAKTVIETNLNSSYFDDYELIVLRKRFFLPKKNEELLLFCGFDTDNDVYTFSKGLCVATNNLDLTQILLVDENRKDLLKIEEKFSLTIYNSTLRFEYDFTEYDHYTDHEYIYNVSRGGFALRFMYKELDKIQMEAEK